MNTNTKLFLVVTESYNSFCYWCSSNGFNIYKNGGYYHQYPQRSEARYAKEERNLLGLDYATTELIPYRFGRGKIGSEAINAFHAKRDFALQQLRLKEEVPTIRFIRV